MSSGRYEYHRSVVVADSPPRGRGVFATRDFQPGEEIEAAPVMALSAEDSARIRRLPFANDLYCWTELPDGEWTLGIVCGVGMLFNHSYRPNADYERDHARKMMVYRAIRPIRAGDEVLINYNGDPAGTEPLWFDVT